MKSGEQLYNFINKITFQLSRVYIGPLPEKETALSATKMLLTFQNTAVLLTMKENKHVKA